MEPLRDQNSFQSSDQDIQPLMRFLSEFFNKRPQIRTVLDIGCGKWGFLSKLNWKKIKYTGIDWIPEIILDNKQYETENIHFHQVNALEYENEFWQHTFDLIFVKDVVQHWPTNIIYNIIPFWLSICNCGIMLINCNFQSIDDQDIEMGEFRPLSQYLRPLNTFGCDLLFHFSTKDVLYIGKKGQTEQSKKDDKSIAELEKESEKKESEKQTVSEENKKNSPTTVSSSISSICFYFTIVCMARNEENSLPRLFESLKSYFISGGSLHLQDTGSTDNTVKLCQKIPQIRVYSVGEKFTFYLKPSDVKAIHKRIVTKERPIVETQGGYFHFSLARNHAASLVKDQFPVILFIDAADYFIHFDFIYINQLIIDCLKKDTDQNKFGGFSYFLYIDEDPFTIKRFYRKSEGIWKHRTHEAVYLSKEYYWYDLPNNVLSLQHVQNKQTNRKGYIAGEFLDLVENPNDARIQYYAARELVYREKWQSAILLFKEYLKNPTAMYSSEKNSAACYLGECYYHVGLYQDFVQSYFQAFEYEATRRQPLLDLSCKWLEKHQFLKAVCVARAALEIEPLKDRFQECNSNYSYLPYQLLLQGYMALKKVPEARKALVEYLENGGEWTEEIKRFASYLHVSPELKLTSLEEKDVVIAILARDKAHCLPLYLYCIDHFNFPKFKTHIYIRTNNNKDNTVLILQDWIRLRSKVYASFYTDFSDTPESIEIFSKKECHRERNVILARLRQASISYALEKCFHYFVIDCNNFILDFNWLTKAFQSNLPVVGPILIRDEDKVDSNYYPQTTLNKSYLDYEDYYRILNQEITGFLQVGVIYRTYFIRHEVLKEISYQDGSSRCEYQIFSDILQQKGIPQYLDNRINSSGILKVPGFFTFMETGKELELKDKLYQETLQLIPTSSFLLYKSLGKSRSFLVSSIQNQNSQPTSQPSSRLPLQGEENIRV